MISGAVDEAEAGEEADGEEAEDGEAVGEEAVKEEAVGEAAVDEETPPLPLLPPVPPLPPLPLKPLAQPRLLQAAPPRGTARSFPETWWPACGPANRRQRGRTRWCVG